jgi:iron complex transport system substrate-binding protein
VRASSRPTPQLDLAADPRSAEGPSTACLPSDSIDAVLAGDAPVLPLTVTDAEGRDVEVTDVSRILPVDISGTIAATVFGLGLGDDVVGRDSSTSFAGTEDLPVVTNSGHTLNARRSSSSLRP